MPSAATPSALILARAAACRAGDFAFVYDSYLEESPFRGQFPSREEYLAYAGEMLAGAVELQECRVLRERVAGAAAQVIFYQRVATRDGVVETLELGHLRQRAGTWKYLGSERLELAALGRPLEAVDWNDFARCSERLVF